MLTKFNTEFISKKFNKKLGKYSTHYFELQANSISILFYLPSQISCISQAMDSKIHDCVAFSYFNLVKTNYGGDDCRGGEVCVK